jgi:signal peptidase I
MDTTVFFLGTFAVLLAALLAANAVFLQLGSHWAKVPNVGFFRALSAVVLAVIIGAVPWVLLNHVSAGGPGRTIVVLVLEILLPLGLAWAIIARVLRTSTWRAINASLATLIPNIGLFLLMLLVVWPFMFEAFRIPTCGMAPTILGDHWEAPCPRCGGPAFCTAKPEWQESSDVRVLMICGAERRSCEVANAPHAQHPGDRIMVAKFLRPRRWDVIVFHVPDDPKTLFCMRLVGLPGETITLKDGAVWIDGKRQTPPDSCKGIEYLDRIERWPSTFWGSQSHPAKLAADEYFVLGDFSDLAKDSRLWQRGAPGHLPYAVPASYIVGVVTHIYWPPSRWRVLR